MKKSVNHFSPEDTLKKLFKGSLSHGTLYNDKDVVVMYAIHKDNSVSVATLSKDTHKIINKQDTEFETKELAMEYLKSSKDELTKPKVEAIETKGCDPSECDGAFVCENCPDPMPTMTDPDLECPNCGDKGDKESYRGGYKCKCGTTWATTWD